MEAPTNKSTIRRGLVEIIRALIQDGVAGQQFCSDLARSLRIEEPSLSRFVEGDLDALSESQCCRIAAVAPALEN